MSVLKRGNITKEAQLLQFGIKPPKDTIFGEVYYALQERVNFEGVLKNE